MKVVYQQNFLAGKKLVIPFLSKAFPSFPSDNVKKICFSVIFTWKKKNEKQVFIAVFIAVKKSVFDQATRNYFVINMNFYVPVVQVLPDSSS